MALKQLLRKRSNIQSSIKSFRTYYLKTQTFINNGDTVNLTEFKLRVDSFTELHNKFSTIHEEIICIVKDDDLNAQNEIKDDFESEYFVLLANAKQIISSLESKDVTPVLVDSSHTDHMTQVSSNRSPGLRLPTIELPKFSGDLNAWLEFKDTFESLINKNNEISKIQKFHYLRASLTGSASQVIQFLDFTTQNYEVAWDVLQNRYNNKTILINSHIKALFELPTVQRETSFMIRQLIEGATKHLRSLKVLGEEVDSWNSIILYILTGKLDKTTVKEWSNEKTKGISESFENFQNFLATKAEYLESIEARDKGPTFKGQKSFVLQKEQGQPNLQCYHCKKSHSIYKCESFAKLSSSQRKARVEALSLCMNCLSKTHGTEACKRSGCKVCNGRHSTLIHVDGQACMQIGSSGGEEVLLPTAEIRVQDEAGNVGFARALLDTGSQLNFVTTNFCKKFQFETKLSDISIMGINKVRAPVSNTCKLIIKSKYNNYVQDINCHVLDTITGYLPNNSFESCNIPANITLADPSFNKSSKIDILLGAEQVWNVFTNSIIKLDNSRLVLQGTKFGYVVAGAVEPTKNYFINVASIIGSNQEVQDQIEKFWTIENYDNDSRVLSKDERECETIFQNTIKRDDCGKFVATIPLKQSPQLLGESKSIALKRFQSLERRFANDHDFKLAYSKFIQEYCNLGHMSKISELPKIHYFLPHHGVINNNSSTTRLRVVFDGSAVTSSGFSLNDLQFVGPKIQQDLVSIVIRFRQHKVVVGGDIEKMYRQVWITPEQRSLQLILWRDSVNDNLETYSLNTVTYGTAAAPYIAVRCINELACSVKESNSSVSETLEKDFYVDDLLTGGDNEEEVLERVGLVKDILASAGFPLRKWISNNPKVIKSLQSRENQVINEVHIGDKSEVKTLGLFWSCNTDTLQFRSNLQIKCNIPTKRIVLSMIAKIYDPLGLISPFIIKAKILLQHLWQCKLDWDDEIPSHLQPMWTELVSDLGNLNSLSISRWVLSEDPIEIQIHGFADASTEAYGACIYIRCANKHGNVSVNLLMAKTKVAPLKCTTIPRLELCAAVILSDLMNTATSSLRLSQYSTFLWSDSNIVLCWLKTESNLLQVFVGNRVAKIQSSTNIQHWHHVRSEHNPADVLSRGDSITNLKHTNLWWSGPEWLSKSENSWPISITENVEIPETKGVKRVNLTTLAFSFPFEKFSTYSKLTRVTTYCLRFINNCKFKLSERKFGVLSCHELNTAKLKLIKICQYESFHSEIENIRNNKTTALPKQLLRLTPFIDEQNIIRVGGRLQLSKFPLDKRNPILLSGKHIFTKLLFRYEHLRLMHAPPQLLLSTTRENYWAINGRSLARSTVFKCIQCFKLKPRQVTPQMGNLPIARLEQDLPFSTVGIDYAGPLQITNRLGRGKKIQSKCYISLFICFVTKAIHVELVTDLTKDAFLASLRRFSSRRGKPKHIYSDNGTNFIGANSELKELYTFLKTNNESIVEALSLDEITWHFIPPQAPHFGGLWEAGVKVIKHHLKRVLGNFVTTYEHMSTILCQIEAIVNSRPLAPLSSDPNDYQALTPAHLLIGRTLTSVPDVNLSRVPLNRLSLYQHLQQIRTHFWTRWSTEYVSQLQERQKWHQNADNLQPGVLVLIKDNNLPPLRWNLGRILEVFPGKDGIVRVASVKTQNGVVRRAFSKLCPLPFA